MNIFQQTHLNTEPAQPEQHNSCSRGRGPHYVPARTFLPNLVFENINIHNGHGPPRDARDVFLLSSQHKGRRKTPVRQTPVSTIASQKALSTARKQNSPCWTVHAVESKSCAPRMIDQDESFIINLNTWAGSTARPEPGGRSARCSAPFLSKKRGAYGSFRPQNHDVSSNSVPRRWCYRPKAGRPSPARPSRGLPGTHAAHGTPLTQRVHVPSPHKLETGCPAQRLPLL